MKQLLMIVFIVAFATNCNKPGTVAVWEDSESGKLLTDWIGLQLRLVRNTTGLTHVAYSRHFSYSSIAFYESLVPGESGYLSLAGQLNGLGGLPAAPSAGHTNWPAAANAAYAAMMRNFYSGNAINLPLIDSMENAWTAIFNRAGSPVSATTAGSDYGKAVAQAIILWSAGDKADKASAAYVPPVGDGLWIPTPPAFAAAASPYWGNDRTIVAHSIDQAMVAAPFSFSTVAGTPYYKQVKELYDTSVVLTAEQKAIATYWDDSPNGKYVTAYGHWSSILAQVVNSRHLKLIDASMAYVAMTVALNDVSISCWKAKFGFNQMRPVSYIRGYFGDSAWLSFITTPAHPEYPAAHACLSYAAANALTNVLGDNISFTDHTYDFLGMSPHSFGNFLAAAEEAGISRFYGGIHYKPSIQAGAGCGKITASAVVSRLSFRRGHKGAN